MYRSEQIKKGPHTVEASSSILLLSLELVSQFDLEFVITKM